MVTCSLCASQSLDFQRLRVLGKYDVAYFRCAECELIQTEKPYWLEESYRQRMSVLDTGILLRNTFCTRLTLLTCLLLDVPRTSKFLDFGGGHGIFTRMMRDLGFNFRWRDAMSENLVAKGFEMPEDERPDFVSCFDVAEHMVHVRSDWENIFLKKPKFVFVGTELHDGNPTNDWPYFSPEIGQHVAFYSLRTMRFIAETFGYALVSGNKKYLLFVDSSVNVGLLKRRILPWFYDNRIASFAAGSLLTPYFLSKSLWESDHRAMLEQLRENDLKSVSAAQV